MSITRIIQIVLIVACSSFGLIKQPLQESKRFLSPPPISWGLNTNFDFIPIIDTKGFRFDFFYNIYVPHLNFGNNELYFLPLFLKTYLIKNASVQNDTLVATGNNVNVYYGITGFNLGLKPEKNNVYFGIGSQGKFMLGEKASWSYHYSSSFDVRKILFNRLIFNYCYSISKRSSLIPELGFYYNVLTYSNYFTLYGDKIEIAGRFQINYKINLSSASSLVFGIGIMQDRYLSVPVNIRIFWDW